ncbi:hypothetical protein LX32DRAFT_599429 [Colletotrichum zoysiae]|uniref:Nuclear pore protein n=1 Tax=Colletotrichum zoysiae TaxID=1216348 RepID=A0AAD9LX61_9PEZI|nr:hypothetical protein LX32DRAFT_599429 [Colletotrichum zoysiae]
MPSQSGDQVFYLDSRGDLTLRIGQKDAEEPYQLVVCSRTVARSSAVFRAMLFGGFAESKSEGESSWVVDLPDDEHHLMFLLLTIIHGNFTFLPEKLNPEELYQLLIVADKYDMVHTLRPMLATWYQPHLETAAIAGNETFLWVAWVLGDKKTFENLALRLVLYSKVDEGGQLLDSNRNHFSKHRPLGPLGILERIAHTREDIIRKIFLLLHETIQARLDNRGCSKYADYPMHELKLNIQQLNSTHMTAPLYLGSVNHLESLIRKTGFDCVCKVLHSECNPLHHIRTEIRQLVKAVSPLVSDAEVERLRKQANKSGLGLKRPTEMDES